jgi:predicted transcriptional regulator
MSEMTNQETDTALILENELKRRVREVVAQVAQEIVRKEMREMFIQQKDSMLMEVSITVGKHLRLIENEGRKPLWEFTPEEIGMTKETFYKPTEQSLD